MNKQELKKKREVCKKRNLCEMRMNEDSFDSCEYLHDKCIQVGKSPCEWTDEDIDKIAEENNERRNEQ